jgi:hypothetical protein
MHKLITNETWLQARETTGKSYVAIGSKNRLIAVI